MKYASLAVFLAIWGCHSTILSTIQETRYGIKRKESPAFELQVHVDLTGTSVHIDGTLVYHYYNKTMLWGNRTARLHAGMHQIAINERSGEVMRMDSFMTWQPRLYQDAVVAFNNIQDGRYVVLVGVPDFTEGLEKELEEQISSEGSLFIDRLAYEEAWVLVVRKNRSVLAEAAAIKDWRTNRDAQMDASPLVFSAVVPLLEEEASSCFHDISRTRERFCSQYEGYGPFCSCVYLKNTAYPAEDLPKKSIPVLILTAHRLPRVRQQVEQIRRSSEGETTPILVCLDEFSQEAKDLAVILNFDIVFNWGNPARKGTSKRISYQMKFCLKESLKVFPEALAVIVLEDDLDLAPDFISFFRQSLVLLQEEESLFCVNAFNRNAYRHVSHDFERLYRTEGVPSYGWMVTSATARDILSQWPQLEKMENYDWDFWVRSSVMGNRTVLVPEVPRTKHTGGGGVHVTGLEQLLVFDRINFNHERSHVTLDIESLTRDVEVVYMPSADDILQASKDPFFRLQIQGMIRLRESPSSLLDEINMANIASLEMVQSTNATSVVLV